MALQQEEKLTLVTFYCSYCPTSKRTSAELQKIAASSKYKDSRVAGHRRLVVRFIGVFILLLTF